jgi:hypothetical protein
MSTSKKSKLSGAQWTAIGVIIAALLAAVATVISSVIQNRTAQRAISTETPVPSKHLLQRIDFDYEDSPTVHGWQMTEGDERQLIFEHTDDNFVGSAIKITSPTRYKLEYDISPQAEAGTAIEFVADLKGDAAIYLQVGLEKEDGTIASGWFRFRPGSGPSEPYYDEATEDYAGEWFVYLYPVSSKGDWMLFQVALEDLMANTFGKDGWDLQRLIKFRLRDNLSLDYISVFE